MSIKDLFGSKAYSSKNYLSDTTQKNAFETVESPEYVRAITTKQNTFRPQIDYLNPERFAKFGSAYLYYKSSIERIADYYPYDGSNAEKTRFYNQCLDIEKYIFDNLYPRTNGYVTLAADAFTVSSFYDDYGAPATNEYITFKGGPGTGSSTTLVGQAPNSYNDKFQYSNIYQENPYTILGLPPDYGLGSRQSNLKSNFENGVTVEFWLKTGSLDASTFGGRQVVVDIWNNESSASIDYGRITIALTGTAEPQFLVTAKSGTLSTGGIQDYSIGTITTSNALSSFSHYAFVIENVINESLSPSSTARDLKISLYVNGNLDISRVFGLKGMGELKSKNMMGRLGALLTAPSGTAETYSVTPSSLDGAGRLSGSIDEFRFWKVARNAQQIGRNWNTAIHGGANTDYANTTLGVYYKFNEGVVGLSNVDSYVLDYAGRICNGVWTGYTTNSRMTASAIVEGGGADSEYKDPIIYSEHPSVSLLKESLLATGSYHDAGNNAALINYIPSWILEDDEASGNENLKILAHIMGAYFDKLYLQISAIPTFKGTNYTSASHKPLPFAQHMPQSMGLYTPDLFVDSNLINRFLNRSENEFFEEDLNDTKNLIYLNLYNNITNIFKSKGTYKSIRNVFRCFNIDERLIRINTYSNEQVYELKNNLEQTLVGKSSLNFDNSNNMGGVVYQAVNPDISDSLGYISGSSPIGYENNYGFTLEADVTFPSYNLNYEAPIKRTYSRVSLFGMHTADTTIPADTSWPASDLANFQVLALKDAPASKNAYFVLTSSNSPNPFPVLTSSMFFDVYNNERWNFSVRLKPSNYPITDAVSGSTPDTYDLIFRGINAHSDYVQDHFTLTASIARATAVSFLGADKRVYVGARRTNTTGSVLDKSDALISSTKYWAKYLDNLSLDQHVYDINNTGISGSSRHIAALDSNNSGDMLNSDTLALHWNFDLVTGSNSTGNFYVEDMSSGSADMRLKRGWLGNLAGYRHTGYAVGFEPSSNEVTKKQFVNAFKFIDPEKVVASDMIEILSMDDIIYRREDAQLVPNLFFTIEKSLYNTISEEMLTFLAGVIDFNNLIGEPVNRYRERYKSLEKLREAFFRRVTEVKQVEKYVEYYKWFDDAISEIIVQLLPASAEFLPDVLNTIESHVLERNKYQSKFPTLEFRPVDPEGIVLAIREKKYNWRLGSAPVSALEREHSLWWKERAERTDSPVISSGDATIDAERDTVRKIIRNDNDFGPKKLTTVTKSVYDSSVYVWRKLAAPYEFSVTNRSSPIMPIKGGVNFEGEKRFGYTYSQLYPAGPVSRGISGRSFLPKNVLLAFPDDFVPLKDTADVTVPNKKIKMYTRVQSGRDWEKGVGYRETKSSFSLPFNIMSSSVTSGYNSAVVNKVTGGIQITNLHNDVYGDDNEVPMQGPFTDYAVGGHQSRHVPLNRGTDAWYNRPEAWKLLLGSCNAVTGVIGMAGADYPVPEANDIGVPAYPLTASQKAVYYRGFTAKRPVNIRNIHHTTGSTILGNYNNNYDFIQAPGATANPRRFVDNQPTLPAPSTNVRGGVGTNIRNFLTLRRQDEGHSDFDLDYTINENTGSRNQSVIISRFGAPGGLETSQRGFQDLRGSEYSVYNSLGYRNLTVIRRQQPPSGTISEATGAGPTGIRVYDIHGKDVGLRPHLARHTARFGRDSVLVPDSEAGASTEQAPGFHKVHRNSTGRLKELTTRHEVRSTGLDNNKCIIMRESDSGEAGAKNVLLIDGTTDMRNPLMFDSASSDQDFTFAGWFNMDSADNVTRIVFSIGETRNGNQGYEFYRGNSDQFVLSLRSWNNVDVGVESSATWATPHSVIPSGADNKTWFHLAVAFSGAHGSLSSTAGADIYINGVAKSITAAGTVNDYHLGHRHEKTSFRSLPGYDVGGPLCIGGPIGVIGSKTFSGSFDEIAFYGSALSASDILELYNDGTPCNLTASVGSGSIIEWWRCGEGFFGGFTDAINSGSVAADSASNSNIVYGNVSGIHLLPTGERNYFMNINDVAMAPTSEPYLPFLTGCVSEFLYSWDETTHYTASIYDNFFVKHPIPRTDMQYAWITGAITAESAMDPVNFGHHHDQPRAPGWTYAPGLIRKATGVWGPQFVWVSGSGVTPGGNKSAHQPSVRLNLWVIDPIRECDNYLTPTGSDDTYTLYELRARALDGVSDWCTTASVNAKIPFLGRGMVGPFPDFPPGTLTPFSWRADYLNHTFIESAPFATQFNDASYANMLFHQRGYGYGWVPLRSQIADHPLLRAHQGNMTFSGSTADVDAYITLHSSPVVRYPFRPVSLYSQTIKMNTDAAIPIGQAQRPTDLNNITLNISHEINNIKFVDRKLNNRLAPDSDRQSTPFDLVAHSILQPGSPNPVNWIISKDRLFPSRKNETLNRTRMRGTTGAPATNDYWRDTNADRVLEWTANDPATNEPHQNSQNVGIAAGNIFANNEPSGWDSRTAPDIVNGPGGATLQAQGNAGELQANYFTHYSGWDEASDPPPYTILSPAVRKDRLHMEPSPLSLAPSFAPVQALFGAGNAGRTAFNTTNPEFAASDAVDIYCGEQKWEVNTFAGELIYAPNPVKPSDTTISFSEVPSNPMWDTVTKYSRDLKILMKDGAVVPEFRIHDVLEDYLNGNEQPINQFTIVSTNENSSNEDFYLNFMNSDILRQSREVAAKDPQAEVTALKLTVKGLTRPRFDNGFYREQRITQLASAFYKSFSSHIVGTSASADRAEIFTAQGTSLFGSYGGLLRPLYSAFWGAFMNTERAAIMTPYPIVIDDEKMTRGKFYRPGGAYGESEDSWALTPYSDTTLENSSMKDIRGYWPTLSKSFWDRWIDEEDLCDPSRLAGLTIRDNETHQFVQMNVSAAISQGAHGRVFSMGMRNYLGAKMEFYLNDRTGVELMGGEWPASGKTLNGCYSMTVKLGTSWTGRKTYAAESASCTTDLGPNDSRWGEDGFMPYYKLAASPNLSASTCPVPQYPRSAHAVQNANFKTTMYRGSPTQYGPPVAGRYPPDVTFDTDLGIASYTLASNFGAIDSFNGSNPAFTPCDADGEAWVHLVLPVFDGPVKLTLEEAYKRIVPIWSRFDPGPRMKATHAPINTAISPGPTTTLIPDYACVSASTVYPKPIYAGSLINRNSQQLSHSVDLFGIEDIYETQKSKDPKDEWTRNNIVAHRPIIKTILESPDLVYADDSDANNPRPISAADGTQTIPVYGGGAASARICSLGGQYGIEHYNEHVGRFLWWEDTPQEFLKFHYSIINENSVWNDYDAAAKGPAVVNYMQSLGDLLGFSRNDNKKRLGEIADQRVVKEAIVIVPYILEEQAFPDKQVSQARTAKMKKFIEVPRERIAAASQDNIGTATGDTLDSAPRTLRNMMKTMKRYNLPWNLDWIQNKKLTPMVMFFAEFEHTFDKNDLVRMYQGIAPKDYKNVDSQEVSIAIEIDENFFSQDTILNENLRWMVFKVKQKSNADFYNHRIRQTAPSASEGPKPKSQGLRQIIQKDSQFDNYRDIRIADYISRYDKDSQNTRDIPDIQVAEADMPIGNSIGNWPYDYFSFVELITIDAEVQFIPSTLPEGLRRSGANTKQITVEVPANAEAIDVVMQRIPLQELTDDE